MVVFIVFLGALCSTCGTLAIKRTENFRKLVPSLLVVGFYGGSTWFLAQAMQYMPIAFAHAAWSGLVALLLLVVDRFYLKLPLTSGQITGFFGVMTGIVLLSNDR